TSGVSRQVDGWDFVGVTSKPCQWRKGSPHVPGCLLQRLEAAEAQHRAIATGSSILYATQTRGVGESTAWPGPSGTKQMPPDKPSRFALLMELQRIETPTPA